MSDVQSQAGTPPPDAGAQLRLARQQAGLHIATLAAMLKVPVQRLQALEDGAYEALPDATFTRALALSVCRTLKIDPAPVLAGLPTGGTPRLTPTSGDLGMPMPRKGVEPALAGPVAAGARRWPLWLAPGLLAVAALVWWWLPPGPQAPVAEAPVREPVAVPASVSPAAEAPAQGAAAGTPPAVPAETAAAAVAPAAAEATSPLAVAPAPSALLIRVSALSWIQVTGSSGRVLLQRNVQPGETLRFDEDLPLAVVVGRADATTVELRGQPLDLTGLARNNVARFEVR